MNTESDIETKIIDLLKKMEEEGITLTVEDFREMEKKGIIEKVDCENLPNGEYQILYEMRLD